MANNNILIIGSFPPPYGGISVHIQRLYDLLVKNNFNCKVLHTGKKIADSIIDDNIIRIFELRKIFKVRKTNPVVHFQVSALGNLFKIYFLTKFFRNQKLVITIHSGTFAINQNNKSIWKKNIHVGNF